MKILLTILLTMSMFPALGQEEYKNREVDTLKIIEAKSLKDLNIKYVTDKNEVVFSKSVTIEFLRRLLAELDTSEAVSDWNLEYYQQQQMVLKYIETKKSLRLSNPWENDTVQSLQQIENNISLLAARHFYELACDMLDNGYFYVKKDGKHIRRLVKAKVHEWDKSSGTTSIKYLLPNGEELWICPPITIADFGTD